MNWKEINYKNIRTFQLEDEPELIHIFELRENELMIVHESGTDVGSGQVEFLDIAELENKYNIKL